LHPPQGKSSGFTKIDISLHGLSVSSLESASVDKFILDTDASDTAIGAELLQIKNGEERVIAYGSCMLAPAQRRYCTTRKELLAIVRFTQHFRHFCQFLV
jgi:hypothetical protein